MSSDEENAIKVRMMTEYVELGHHTVPLEHEILRRGKLIESVALQLERTKTLPVAVKEISDDQWAALDGEKLKELLEDLQRTVVRRRELREQLSKLGLL